MFQATDKKQESRDINIGRWALSHPLEALARLAWVILNMSLGALLGGILMWGPLGAARSVVFITGSVGGLLVGGLWLFHQLAKVRRGNGRTQPWQRALAWGTLVIFVGATVITGFHFYRLGAFLPPWERSYVANFERLGLAIERHYPYFEEKEIEWASLYDRYHQRVEKVQTDIAYHTLVSQMLAEFNDGHTRLTPGLDLELYCKYVLLEEVDGHAIAVLVGGRAQAAGLSLGDEIVSIDQQPVEVAAKAVDSILTIGSSPWQRRQKAYRELLTTPRGATRTFTFRTAAGAEKTVTLECPASATASESDPKVEPEVWEILRPLLEGKITSQRLPSGHGYIRIPSFGKRQTREFDRHLDSLMDTPGLVLDLRGNGGGATFFADPLAGRFIDEPFTYGHQTFPKPIPVYGWRREMSLSVRPRRPVYDKPVVLLIDGWNMSTAESFIASLLDSGRAQSVGHRTSGSSGNPMTFRLIGGRGARFSTGALYRSDGTSIEGIGIKPHIEVTWTPEDIRSGHDPDIAAAEDLLNP
jgi:carboxyl-terminal processing protease